MKRFKVTWEIEVTGLTPRDAAAQAIRKLVVDFEKHGDDWTFHSGVTVTGLDDEHTSQFIPEATEALR